MSTESTCTSWIAGKLSDEVEINTRIPYVSIYGYFFQGDEADEVINEINAIYNTNDCTPIEAANKWAANSLTIEE
jgi:hypothetical protein